MAVFPIRTFGDAVLNTVAEPVAVFDETLEPSRVTGNVIEPAPFDILAAGLCIFFVALGLRMPRNLGDNR